MISKFFKSLEYLSNYINSFIFTQMFFINQLFEISILAEFRYYVKRFLGCD